MLHQPTVSPLHFKRHIGLYEKLIGPFDYEYFDHNFGVTEAKLNQAGYRVPLAAATAFFELCAVQLSDPCFGITWAQKAPYTINDRIVRCMAAVPDTRAFFQQNIRVSRLTSELAEFSIAPFDEQHQLLEMHPTELAPTCYHQVDATMLYVMRATRFILRHRFPGTQTFSKDFSAVLFTHACPDDMEQKYQAAFGVPVLFNQERNGLLMVNQWLDVRLLPGQPSIDDVVACEVENMRLQQRHSHADIVQQCIEHLLPYGAPSRETVAEAMHMSVRTLQRKLKDEGVGYQNLLDGVRKRLAQDYIQRDCYPMEEVAFLLGYSNITAFYAAYRRWFDATPRGQNIECLQASDADVSTPESA